MDPDKEKALHDLAGLGFKGRDVYLAELLPVVEMAWADGVIAPNERALLEAYCEQLTERLNRQAGAQFFGLTRALLVLDRLTERRLSPAERLTALKALKTWSGRSSSGEELRSGMLEWAAAVAAVDGSPVWDTRELFWLQTMKRTLEDGS
ncbi:MAG: hypothetical protein Q8N23_04725 [Archangium sp.]|nr:hypothetical protein [Archangium sp.]MDP3151948.1 hypothetical protein [Archangium sp.]MDP3571361.1 hypothetical protein [Archangium sp.]